MIDYAVNVKERVIILNPKTINHYLVIFSWPCPLSVPKTTISHPDQQQFFLIPFQRKHPVERKQINTVAVPNVLNFRRRLCGLGTLETWTWTWAWVAGRLAEETLDGGDTRGQEWRCHVC